VGVDISGSEPLIEKNIVAVEGRALSGPRLWRGFLLEGFSAFSGFRVLPGFCRGFVEPAGFAQQRAGRRPLPRLAGQSSRPPCIARWPLGLCAGRRPAL